MEIMNIFLLSKDWILTKSHSKFHYQIAYKIGMNRNEYILLDVLYEDTHYKKVNCLSLENPFVEWDGEPVKVNVLYHQQTISLAIRLLLLLPILLDSVLQEWQRMI